MASRSCYAALWGAMRLETAVGTPPFTIATSVTRITSASLKVMNCDRQREIIRDRFFTAASTTARARPLATACTYCGPNPYVLRLAAILGRPRSPSLRHSSSHASWSWQATTGHCATRPHDPVHRRLQHRPDRDAGARRYARRSALRLSHILPDAQPEGRDRGS